jgi:hypothetical protein
MKDFKKMPKMACGGSVGKYSEGKSVKNEDFEPKQTRDIVDKSGNTISTMPETDAVRSANSNLVRPLNMGIKSKATKASQYKRGGKVKK